MAIRALTVLKNPILINSSTTTAYPGLSSRANLDSSSSCNGTFPGPTNARAKHLKGLFGT
jgi:hypothetical protein